tara:strand:+ start:666 stop:1121 length:456 start_codon:yes stop_codon:yes gene_type:complete
MEDAFLFRGQNSYTHALILNDDITFPFDWEMLESLAHEGFVLPPEKYDWCAFMVSRERYKQIGCFDQGFHPAYFEGWDYAYRMKLQNLPIVNTDKFTPLKYRYAQSLQKDPSVHDNFHKLQLKYITKWGGLKGQEQFTEPYNRNKPPCKKR